MKIQTENTGKVGKNNSFLKTIIKQREISLIIILMVMGISLSLLTTTFADATNIFNVARQISLIVIIALGETLVLISGGIDLSIGSILGLSGIITALASSSGVNAITAIILGLVMGSACGLINGVLITKVRINPFIATLGMLSIARGVVLVITKGYSITVVDPLIIGLGQGYFGPIPVPVIIMAVLVVIMAIIYSTTIFGSHLQAMGGNERGCKNFGNKY